VQRDKSADQRNVFSELVALSQNFDQRRLARLRATKAIEADVLRRIARSVGRR